MTDQKKINRFQVYTASAGAGKTYKLTLEYLKIALRKPEEKFQKILAITFTVKATNEMKQRILEACKAFSQADEIELTGRNKSLFNDVLEQENYTEQEIIAKAKNLFKQLLHNYGDFAVSTIDSFSQRIIRSFAYELKKPINFDIEIDKAKTADYLTSQLLAKVGGEDKQFTKLVTSYFNEKLQEDDSTYIENDILNAVEIMLDESSEEALQQLQQLEPKQLVEVQNKLFQNYLNLKKTIEDLGNEALVLIKNGGLKIEDFRGGSRSSVRHFETVTKDVFKEPVATFIKIVNGETSWFTGNTSYPELENQLAQIGEKLIKLYPEIVITNELRKVFPKMAMLAELRKLFETYQNEEEFLLISEFNRIISEHVKGQPAPFLYEKVGEKYEHILIDEFQDTSVMQWHNLVPLVVESLLKDEHNESLIVGDSKQAIYRFRGGETRQLNMLPKLMGSEDDFILQENEQTLSHFFGSTPLEYNYRSREEIVNFNNQLYGFVNGQSELHPYHEIYCTAHQRPSREGSGGYVQANVVEKRDYKEESYDEFNERWFDQIKEQIDQVLKHGYEESDIAILCRKNKELQLIASYLQLHNYNFISKESLSIIHEKAVEVFPSLVRLFIYPSNQILQAEIANLLIDYGLLNISHHQVNQDIGRKKFTTIQAFSKYIQSINSEIQLTKMNQAELLKLWEQYVSWLPAKTQNSSYISFFRDEIWEQIQIHGNNIEAFLDWWDETKENLYIKSGDDATGIQLMTIHKAKGLEFEVVLLPYANWSFTSTDNKWVKTDQIPSEQVDRAYFKMKNDLASTSIQSEVIENKQANFLDSLNLLYVATTRAVSELYFIVDNSTLARGKTIAEASNLSQFLHEFFQFGESTEISFGSATHPDEKQSKYKQEILLSQEAKSFEQVEVVVNNRASAIWNDEVRGKIDFGSILHKLLETIKTEQDVQPVLYNALSEGIITEQMLDEVSQMLHQVVNNEQLKPYFMGSQSILAEQSILTPDGQEFIPDRIILHEDNSIQLLDFKTGQQKSAHQAQLEQYTQLLTQMGYTVTEQLIVYLQPFEIISL